MKAKSAPRQYPPLSRLFRVLLLWLLFWWPHTGWAATAAGDGISGTYPGRVLTELALHRQYRNQRIRAGYLPQALTEAIPLDVGNIAVLPDDGTLVIRANSFDLDQATLLFQPTAGGFTVARLSSQFDAEAAANGILLNPTPASNPANIGDDGTRQLPLGFFFPFFSNSYTDVFINSDGNLTFQAGDTAITQRSLARFLSGPPRIAPYFADLDPSLSGQLTYFSSSTRFVVTWSAVPDYSSSGLGPRETFQVTLRPDGRIAFSYNGISGREAVVGISPGQFTALPTLLDLSQAAGTTFSGPAAEIFTRSTSLDLAAVAQRFYQSHEDAYDFLIVFTTFDMDLGGAFAFELNIANDVTGIGHVSEPPVFDFSSDFGSSRLQSLLNMGSLARYPPDPSAPGFLPGRPDSTMSILGQETGHRFLVYVRFNDPEGASDSTALLGRDLQHWSFLFNSEASVMEGNRIRDNGDGTFTTTGAVEHYNEIDQYLMGLLSPDEVSPTFLVKFPSLPINPSRAPALNVTFAGRRADVLLDQIIEANGPRIPNSVIAPKHFRFAFVLVSAQGSTPTTGQIAHLDTIRQAWEPYFEQATSARGTANTSLVRGLRLAPSPLGLFSGSQWEAKVELLATASSNVLVTLANSNPSAAGVPSSVVIPSGARSATFNVTGLAPGMATINASAPGFETVRAVVRVFAGLGAAGLTLAVTDGDRQVGAPGSNLPRPLRVALRDSNQIPLPGARVEFVVSQGEAGLSVPEALTDGQGIASVGVRLGEATGPVAIVASVPGTSLRAPISLFTLGKPSVPLAGIVRGASFALWPAPVAPGSIIAIFGTNLASSTASASSVPWPRVLGGTSVEINGTPIPLLFVSPLQIQAQLPSELSGSMASLIVRNEIGSSEPVAVSLALVAPAIFSKNMQGTGEGAITFASSQLPVGADRPARAGDFVQVFATGLGPVSPTVRSGESAPLMFLSRTTFPVTATLSGVPALVDFAGLAPSLVGVYQVNVQIPAGVSGTVPLVLTSHGVSSNAVIVEVR
ncbi:MAG: hypothetical protein HY649_11200 [Acidobacteria bacterium]|nr:hypothetical protein [Acidobacteriota bacterium]